MQRKSFFTAFSVLAVLAINPLSTSAEWFADLYVGAAFTQSENMKLTFLDTIFKVEELEFDSSASFGGRLGHWFEAVPYLGVALDVSHFRPDISAQSVTVCRPDSCFTDPNFHFDLAVTTISFDAMVRWPLLRSSAFPNGQLQPYLTIGPAIFVASGKDLVTTGGPVTRSETNASVGPKLGAGLAWQFHRTIALFGEYRFTHFSPEFSLRDVFILGSTDKVETEVNTHHLVLGISIRF